MQRNLAESAVKSLSTYLNPKVWNDRETVPRIGRGLMDGRRVAVRNCMAESFSERPASDAIEVI